MMHPWHWPQWIFAALYALSVLSLSYRLGAKKPTTPPTGRSFLVVITIQAGLIYTLHCGGFW